MHVGSLQSRAIVPLSMPQVADQASRLLDVTKKAFPIIRGLTEASIFRRAV